MDDIFTQTRDGNAMYVRVWLDHPENDLNQGDDHGFSPLHWACMEGKEVIVDLLIGRGCKINAINMGEDTPLHLAAAHGHREIVVKLLQWKAIVDAPNEHGNTPLHYACFWGFDSVAEELVTHGALVSLCNKYGESPLDKSKPALSKILRDRASALGQDLGKIGYQEKSWSGTKTRTREGKLSRHSGIDYKQVKFRTKINENQSGELWKGSWQGTDVMVKVLRVTNYTSRISRDFAEEFPRLRIFSHPNILPVLGCCNQPPHLLALTEYMSQGSLYDVLHEDTDMVVDQNRTISFAVDVARGMQFLHAMENMIPRFYLNSKSVMIDEEGVAKINMGDTKFSFQNRGKFYNTAWMAPESLQKKPEDMNVRAADMWSFAVLLWELVTREVPFAGMSPMEIGMKVAWEGLRVAAPPGTSNHMSKLIKICMNEDQTKRPRFDMILPILEKMRDK